MSHLHEHAAEREVEECRLKDYHVNGTCLLLRELSVESHRNVADAFGQRQGRISARADRWQVEKVSGLLHHATCQVSRAHRGDDTAKAHGQCAMGAAGRKHFKWVSMQAYVLGQ